MEIGDWRGIWDWNNWGWRFGIVDLGSGIGIRDWDWVFGFGMRIGN